jgi:hypothetical protein
VAEVAAEAVVDAPAEIVAEAPAADVTAAVEVAAKPARRRSSRAKTPAVAIEAEALVDVAPEPVLETVSGEPAAPLVKPIVIGADTPAAEKRRGWWKR